MAALRKRLNAEESRERILVAAERHLVDAGPEGLRLTQLAEDLGLSHPAILHHFGSREGLVGAVLERAYASLRDDILRTLRETDDPVTSAPALLDRAARVLSERGHARLFGWLVLSGRSLPELFDQAPLQAIAESVQTARGERLHDAASEETQRVVHLVGLALLGEALFGDRLRAMQGIAPGVAEANAFRAWLVKLATARLLE